LLPDRVLRIFRGRHTVLLWTRVADYSEHTPN
jgi:hypothetical protein